MLRKKTASLFLIIALLLAVLPFTPTDTAAMAADDDPVAVEGRTLPRDKAGDTSAWIEIARYGEYSLILRQEPLTDQLTAYSTTLKNNTYVDSLARKGINDWYNNKLHGSARLRDFAVKNDAMRNMGTIGASSIDGLSIPLGGAARTGNDVAFSLSYCEAVLYCSTQYAKLITSSTLYPSSTIAKNNFGKLLPKYVGAYVAPAYWLRTLGNTSYAAGCVAYTGGDSNSTHGRAYQHTVIGTYAHYRPAIWVGSGIFAVEGRTITGKVWPMVAEDTWGLGSKFMAGHDIVVELRSTFLTPAPQELRTKAVLKDDTGLGEFTFKNVPNGNYILCIMRSGYLARAMKVSITDASPKTITLAPPGAGGSGIFDLWWGDCNGDGRIDNDDVMMILELMNMGVNAYHPYYNPACDLNGDGLIDNEDIMMVLEMWDKMILNYPGSEGIDPFK